MANNSTTRFSNRVDDYVKYRPGYPDIILTYLKDHFELNSNQVIADIGAGTGISTALFLNVGYPVIAVEPNREMREKLAELLSHFSNLTTINGTAENTTLPDSSVDMILAGQAFHWFDQSKSKEEFKRILKTGGRVALIWNERKTITPFESEYEKLIKTYGKDYEKIDHRNINDSDIEAFFFPQHCTHKIFENFQSFDLEGLTGRLLSSSYMPVKGEAGYNEMIVDLKKLFGKCNLNNRIRINYDTKLYTGRLK